jgi:hypothetical protein
VNTKPIVSATTPSSPLTNKDGTITFAWLKYFQNIGTLLNTVFDQQANLQPGAIPLPTADSIGGVEAAGPVAHEWVAAIATDGSIVLLQPAFSDLSGTASPSQVPALSALNGGVSAGQVPQLSQLAGMVKPSQVPDLSTLNGAVTAAQVPPLSALDGEITAAQLPPGGFSGTITTAKLTVGGANGSMTFTDGQLTGEVPAT